MITYNVGLLYLGGIVIEEKNDFESYLERYCNLYHITPDEAKKHKIVQEVQIYYEERGET